MGVVGATWVAASLLGVWPEFGDPTVWDRVVESRVLVMIGLGLVISCSGCWLAIRDTAAARLLRAGLAALSAIGFVLAGLASAQLISWLLYSWEILNQQGWGFVISTLVLPFLAGVVVGLAALYGVFRMRGWQPGVETTKA